MEVLHGGAVWRCCMEVLHGGALHGGDIDIVGSFPTALLAASDRKIRVEEYLRANHTQAVRTQAVRALPEVLLVLLVPVLVLLVLLVP
jgi:hypothetical protein